MHISACILLYGLDPVLLDTRRMMLERTGHRVFSATNLAEVEQISLTQPIQLFIVCHSVSREACETVLAAVQELCPTMLLLVLTKAPCDWPDEREVLSIYDGPAAFVATVARLLDRVALRT
jgi:hypothetical protein